MDRKGTPLELAQIVRPGARGGAFTERYSHNHSLRTTHGTK
jgi:hypothetical protein